MNLLKRPLLSYPITEDHGRLAIKLLGLHTSKDVSRGYGIHRRYFYSGKYFVFNGGAFHIFIHRTNTDSKENYALVVDHYDPPNHQTRFIPSYRENKMPPKKQLYNMKKRIEYVLQSIENGNSDIFGTHIIRKESR